MSDENTTPPAPASSAQEHMIPKSRLDEVLQERNQLRQQAEIQQRLLQNLSQQQQPRRVPQAEDPRLKAIRERDPETYAVLVEQKREAAQLRAMAWAQNEQRDREQFMAVAGRELDKYKDQVEAILDQQRQAGNFNVNRAQVFATIKGHEAIERERRPAPATQQASTPAQTQAAPQASGDVPPSDTSFIPSIPQGSAQSDLSKLSREEVIAKYGDIEF